MVDIFSYYFRHDFEQWLYILCIIVIMLCVFYGWI